MNRTSIVVVGIAAVAAVALRVAPPLPFGNFSALGALALLCGAVVRPVWVAIAIPLLCRGITDVVIEMRTGYGFYGSWMFDYSAYAVVCLLAYAVPLRGWKVPLAGVGSAVIFFVLSNFGVWFMPHGGVGAYSRDLSGLMECFAMGLPFIKGTLAGDVFYSCVFFGALSAAEHVAMSNSTEQIAPSGTHQ
jgi:Family of unknown function (DUF6580)